VDLMLCLFPFETAIYRQHGVAARYVGHPLADELPLVPDRGAARAALGFAPGEPLLALLPGSRGSEVALLGPLFLQAAELLSRRMPELRFAIPAAGEGVAEALREQIAHRPGIAVTLLAGRSRELMTAADAVLLASGTATLEAALCKRPMVVAYRMAPLSWALVSRLVRTPYAALPNILAERPLVPELLQDAASPESMADALMPLLASTAAAQAQLRGFESIHRELRRDSAEQSATALVELLEERGRG
jgi:lipid-A-disaccharide synthase